MLFVIIEQRAAEPILPLGLFRNRVFAVSTGANAVFGAVLCTVRVDIHSADRVFHQMSGAGAVRRLSLDVRVMVVAMRRVS